MAGWKGNERDFSRAINAVARRFAARKELPLA